MCHDREMTPILCKCEIVEGNDCSFTGVDCVPVPRHLEIKDSKVPASFMKLSRYRYLAGSAHAQAHRSGSRSRSCRSCRPCNVAPAVPDMLIVVVPMSMVKFCFKVTEYL
jgi:hypothetical protein